MFDEIELSDNIIEEIEQYAQEELEYSAEEVFFFGEIYDDTPNAINDDYPKACCPVCGSITKLPKRPRPQTYDDFTCPKCGKDGKLFDFRDTGLPLNCYNSLSYAYLETLDKGYVLRLFKVGLDYSDREYDDYTKLNYYPFMVINEIGREYWYNGKVEYFENKSTEPLDMDFIPCERLDDTEFLIINYECEKSENEMIDTQYIDDILYELNAYKSGINFIEYFAKKLSFNTFNTLQKYGFIQLANDYIYYPSHYPKSNKISEILGVDYNQLIAFTDIETLSTEDLLNARKLNEYNIKLSKINLEIVAKLNDNIIDKNNARKTFKYLRNLLNKTNVHNVVYDYNDYISDCKKLKFDIESNEIRFPSKFMEKHLQYAMQIEEEENPQIAKNFKIKISQFENLQIFQSNDLIIRLVQTPIELKIEGKILHHCVGGYVDRISKGTCLIFFIRKKEEPDMPFFTLEYDPKNNKIVQCRGDRNCNYENNSKVKKTVNEWFNWVTKLRKKHKAA